MDPKKTRVYIDSRDVANEILGAIQSIEKNPSYRLTEQVQASCSSICHNLLEGFGRTTTGEKLQMLSHANGSAWETIDALADLSALGVISEDRSKKLELALRRISVQIALIAASLLDGDPDYRGKYRMIAERGRKIRTRWHK